MRGLVFLAVLLKTVYTQTINKCYPFFIDDRLGFDLTQLDVQNNYNPYEVPVSPFTNSRNVPVNNAKIVFKVCGAIDTPPANCTAGKEIIAYYIEGTTCLPMTTLLSEREQSLNKDSSDNDNVKGVNIWYNNGNLQAEVRSAMNYSIKFAVTCDKAITTGFKWSAAYSDGGYITASTTGAPGCNYGIGDLLDMFARNRFIFFPIFIVLGGIFTFFGRHAYRWTLLGVGLILGFLVVTGICYATGYMIGASDTKRYIIYAIGIAVGALSGYLMFRFEENTTSVVVATFALIICKAVLVLFLPQISMNGYVTMILLIICGAIGGVVASQWRDPSLIFSTSFGGAFMSVLCFGYLTTLLDPPGVIVSKARAGESIVAPYLFGMTWIGLSVGGLIFQCKQLKKEQEQKEAEKDKATNGSEPASTTTKEDAKQKLAENPL